MPGTVCNSSDVAVFKFTGATGGFLLAAVTKGKRERVAISSKPFRSKRIITYEYIRINGECQ